MANLGEHAARQLGVVDECVDEAHAILPPEAQKPGFAKGFDFAQLQTDVNDVAN